MNIQAKYPTTPDEFLRWNEGREGKREFVNGRVVEMMINVTRNHVEIAGNLYFALRRQLDPRRFSIGAADFAIRSPNGIRYPDVFVDRKQPEGRGGDLAAVEPVLLAEVLSPSSFARDFVDKAEEYRSIGSLLFYLILSHQEQRAWLFSREEGRWTEQREFVEDEIINLSDLRVELPLAEIYEGVDLSR